MMKRILVAVAAAILSGPALADEFRELEPVLFSMSRDLRPDEAAEYAFYIRKKGHDCQLALTAELVEESGDFSRFVEKVLCRLEDDAAGVQPAAYRVEGDDDAATILIRPWTDADTEKYR
ncbi:exported protein of unknown function [Nitratireductor aquimarinus]